MSEIDISEVRLYKQLPK